jgi:hypothetical protein
MTTKSLKHNLKHEAHQAAALLRLVELASYQDRCCAADEEDGDGGVVQA